MVIFMFRKYKFILSLVLRLFTWIIIVEPVHPLSNYKKNSFVLFIQYKGNNIKLNEYFTGSSHTDDSCYVLNCSFLNTGETKTDLAMRELFLDMWINFAKSEK